MTRLMKFSAFSVAASLTVLPVLAQQLDVDEQLAAKERVQTAVALARIAEEDGDGDALLVAARLFASVGNVAKQGVTDGDKPVFYSVGDVAAAAKALGADDAKADALASELPETSAERSFCYWEYKCGTFDCGWVYNC